MRRLVLLFVLTFSVSTVLAQYAGVSGKASLKRTVLPLEVYRSGTSITFSTVWTNGGIDLQNPYVVPVVADPVGAVAVPSTSFTGAPGDDPDWIDQTGDGRFVYGGIFRAGQTTELRVSCITPAVSDTTTYTFTATFYDASGTYSVAASCTFRVGTSASVSVIGFVSVLSGSVFVLGMSLFGLYKAVF